MHMDKNLYSWIIFIFAGFQTIHAQISIGPKIGFNQSIVTVDTRNISDTKTEELTGLNVGLATEIGLSNFLSLKSGFFYAQKGYQVRKYTSKSNLDADIKAHSDQYLLKMHYLELPVTSSFFYGGKRFKIFADIGFYTAYWFDASKSGIFNINDLGSPEKYLGTKEVNEPYIFDNEYGDNKKKDNRWDFGGVIGGGFGYKMKSGELFIDAHYKHGFMDIVSFQGNIPKTYSEQMNRNWSFSIGYIIKLKSRKTKEEISAPEQQDPQDQ